MVQNGHKRIAKSCMQPSQKSWSFIQKSVDIVGHHEFCLSLLKCTHGEKAGHKQWLSEYLRVVFF